MNTIEDYVKEYIALRLQSLECKDTSENEYVSGFNAGSINELEGLLLMLKVVEPLLNKNEIKKD